MLSHSCTLHPDLYIFIVTLLFSFFFFLVVFFLFFFFQAEDGIRDLVRSRGLGDVYKRQGVPGATVRRGRVDLLGDGALARADDVASGRVDQHLSLIHI